MKELIHGGDIYSFNKNIIDFSANINPLGMPLSVKKAIIDNIENYKAYPDPLCRSLRKALAKKEKTSMENILCGNGAADIIFKIALGIKPKKALILSPTFSEYEEALKLVNCKINYYKLKEENNFFIKDNILNYLNEEIDIIFLCNPNNPTGILLEKEKVLKILKRCKEKNIIMVIDECFMDFIYDEENYSISSYINNFKNLIILKAFTKIYAMAGIRLGYMLSSNEEIINKISSIGQPWSVSSVAAFSGEAALKEEEFVNKTKLYIKENREFLKKELENLGFKVFNSKANYIFFKSNILNLKEYLKEKGVLIRSCNNYIALNKDYYRIAVKSKEDNKILIKCLKELIKEKENENYNGYN